MPRSTAVMFVLFLGYAFFPGGLGFSTYNSELPNGAALTNTLGFFWAHQGTSYFTGTVQGPSGAPIAGYRKSPRQAALDTGSGAAVAWSADICILDDDGDGYSSGVELGDPCCVWTTSSTATPYGTVTHPGIHAQQDNNVNYQTHCLPTSCYCEMRDFNTVTLPACETFQVPSDNFCAETCGEYTCEGSGVERDPSKDLTPCPQGGCTDNLCCVDIPTCSSFNNCPQGSVLDPLRENVQCTDTDVFTGLTVCDAGNWQHCCVASLTCAAYGCPQGFQVDPQKVSDPCVTAFVDGQIVCTNNSVATCCIEAATCDSFTCPGALVSDPQKEDVQCEPNAQQQIECTSDFCCLETCTGSQYQCPPTQNPVEGVCISGTCDDATCCVAKKFCGEDYSECTTDGYILDSSQSLTECSANGCDDNTCCKEQTCEGYFCQDPATVGLVANFEQQSCLSDSNAGCSDADCCESYPICGQFQCPPQYISIPTEVCRCGECTVEVCCRLRCDTCNCNKRRGRRWIESHVEVPSTCDNRFKLNHWAFNEKGCDFEHNVTAINNVTASLEYKTEYDGTQTFKWARSTEVDGGEAFVQFSRQGLYGGQYGPTTKHGRLVKLNLSTGSIEAELVGEGGENRWAPFVHGDCVYTVLSHFLHHADYNYLGGTEDVGRVGHWLYKLDRKTLKVIGRREVSCDLGLFDTKEGHEKCLQVTNFADKEQVATYLGDVQGTTQLNGVIAASEIEDDDRCGRGEKRMIVGISGYPYFYGFSDEPQNRALGLHNFHHYGKLMAFCTGSLLPAWKDPYRNSHAVDNEAFNESTWSARGGTTTKRDLMVGDTIPASYLKPGNEYIGALKQLNCSNIADDTRKLLPKYYVVEATNIVEGASQFAVGDIVSNGAAEFKISFRETLGSNTATLHLMPYQANYGNWSFLGGNGQGSVFQDKADVSKTFTFASVQSLRMETCYIESSSSGTPFFEIKVFNDVKCIEWDIPTPGGVLGPVGTSINQYAPMVQQNNTMVPVCSFVPESEAGLTNALPTVKVLVEVGDTVEDEDMRISLGNFGGSFWFRAATDGNIGCSPAGNGAGESMDKYFQTIEILKQMIDNDKRVNTALSAYLNSESNTDLMEYQAALAERESIAKSKTEFRSQLSEADYANANSAIHCFSMVDGSRVAIVPVTGPDTWLVDSGLNGASVTNYFKDTQYDAIADALGQYSYVDAETNNILIITEKTCSARYLVGSTKGGAVFTIDADTFEILHLHSIGQQPTGALGTDASMNFGGMCYPGSGDIVVFATSAASIDDGHDFLFILPNGDQVLMPQGTSALVGYNYKTGQNAWVVLRGSDRAVGVECVNGLAYVSNPVSETVLAVNTIDGSVQFELPAAGCDSHYNCAEVVSDDDANTIYLSTNSEFSKFKLVPGESNVEVDTTIESSPPWCNKTLYNFPAEYPSGAFLLYCRDAVGLHGYWVSEDFPHPGGSSFVPYIGLLQAQDGSFVPAMSLSSQINVVASHGDVHVDGNGGITERVQQYVAEYMVGYSSPNGTDFCVDESNPFEYFGIPVSCL